MTPDTLARLHSAAFTDTRPWSAEEFATLLTQTGVTALSAEHGFALIRILAGESELLTLAVDPAHQRHGIATGLMQRWLAQAGEHADTAFLEVEADNQPALALYSRFDFAEIARRPAYYARKNGQRADAVIMKRALTCG